MKRQIVKSVIEMGFIIFLFYSNLYMGEFEKSGIGRKFGYIAAFEDMLTIPNFIIALVASFIGFMVFSFLRNKY